MIFLKAEALLREPRLARNLVELLARKNLQLSRRMRVPRRAPSAGG